MNRKQRRAWQRDNETWMLAARSGLASLAVALGDLKGGRYDDGLRMARYARKDFRWARWYGFKRHGLSEVPPNV